MTMPPHFLQRYARYSRLLLLEIRYRRLNTIITVTILRPKCSEAGFWGRGTHYFNFKHMLWNPRISFIILSNRDLTEASGFHLKVKVSGEES